MLKGQRNIISNKENRHLLLWWLLILSIVSGSFYIGYRYGYEKAIQIGREKKISKTKALKKEIRELPKKGVMSSQKWEGKEPIKSLYLLTCKEARQNILDFLSYLNEKGYLQRYLKGEDIKIHLRSILEKLSKNLPDTQGERMRSEIMISNIYHLFRSLTNEDVGMIKEIIKHESHELEYVMRWYYVWLISQDRCSDTFNILPSMKMVHTYACYFLNTIGGRSYLFRRSTPVRLLLTYYCVIIVHDMAKRRKDIYYFTAKELIDELKRFPELKFQRYYISRLKKIIRE